MEVTGRDRQALNQAVYEPGQRRGHYESFYQRANHPSEPMAFWIRYTIFAPDERPDEAIGELWAILFDGRTNQHVVAKAEFPFAHCDFARDRFAVRVGDAMLGPGALSGTVGDVHWDLSYSGDAGPLLLFPDPLYKRRIPRAKSLAASPLVTYAGHIDIGDRTIDVTGWRGSQCHNWGSRHTDRYAFVQVCGFDGDPDSVLEAGTAKATLLGPLMTPVTTFVVLRHRGRQFRLNRLQQAMRATGSYRWFDWEFTTGNDDVELIGHVHAPPEAFVGLRYANPPGGEKHCLTTAIGSCELTVVDQHTGERTLLRSARRAMLDFVTDPTDHGVAIRA